MIAGAIVQAEYVGGRSGVTHRVGESVKKYGFVLKIRDGHADHGSAGHIQDHFQVEGIDFFTPLHRDVLDLHGATVPKPLRAWE